MTCNYLSGLDLEPISQQLGRQCDRPLIVPLDIVGLRVCRSKSINSLKALVVGGDGRGGQEMARVDIVTGGQEMAGVDIVTDCRREGRGHIIILSGILE